MSNILIYGTLKNDTKEPIALASQIWHEEKQKYLTELLEESAVSSGWKGPVVPFAIIDSANMETFADSGVEITADQVQSIVYDESTHFMYAKYSDAYYTSVWEGKDAACDTYGYPAQGVLFIEVNEGSLWMCLTSSETDGDDREYLTQVNKCTGSSGTGLTPWQEQYLKGLEEQEVAAKFSASATATPSSKEIDGTDTDVVISVSPTFDGSPVEATVTSAGLTFAKSGNAYKATAPFPKPTGTSGYYTKSWPVKVTYTKDGKTMEKNLNPSFTLYSQCRILQTAGTTAPTAAEITAATNKRRNITGSYQITITPNQYVWLCVPEGIGSVSKITSSGFAVPFEAAVNVSVAFGTQTVNFKCYRISGAPQTSPMDVNVS